MKKRFLLALLATVTACTAFGLVACGDDGGSDSTQNPPSDTQTPAPHEHVYEQGWIWEDYMTAYFADVCDCGDYINAVEAMDMDFDGYESTCTEDGEVTSTAYVLVDETVYSETKTFFLPATGHSPVGAEEVSCWWGEDMSVASMYYPCEWCYMSVDTDATITVDDSNVSCTEGGMATYTATATIDGVTYTDVVEDVFIPARGHDYNDENVCDHCGERKPSEGLAFEIDELDYAYTVTGRGDCTDSEIVIPATYEGKPVQYIGTSAFAFDKTLTSVTIPDSVEQIYPNAFDSCTNLTNVSLGKGVWEISTEAFAGCNALTSFEIPENVTHIRDGAFLSCKGFTSFTVPATVTSIGKGAFSGCTNLESITLPFVGSKAGNGAANKDQLFGYIFGELSLSGGTTQYWSTTSYAWFTIPEKLTSVTIAGGYVAYGSFYNCSNLKTVVLGENVTGINSTAFYGCSSLENLTVPFVGNYEGASIDNDSCLFGSIFGKYFAGTTSVTHESVNSSPTFYIPNTLKTVTVLDGGENIYTGAFSNCGNLTSITIGDGAKYIWDKVFKNCSSLTSVTLPNTVVSISVNAFGNCSNLTHIYFNGTLEEWNAVNKISGWNAGMGEYTIVCTDGSISESGVAAIE